MASLRGSVGIAWVLPLLLAASGGAQVTLSTNFEGGALSGSSYAGGVWTVGSNWSWMYFRVNNAAGQVPQFRTPAPNGVEPYNSYHRMVWRYAGQQDWQFMDYGSQPGDGYYYFHNNAAFTQSTVEIAYWQPYTYTQVQQFHQSVTAPAHAAYVRNAGSAGSSYQGRDLYRFEVTDPGIPDLPKQRVVIVARQHGYESLGNYVTEGLVEFLLSDDPAAAELRRKAVFHIYPMANPDAAYNGWTREGRSKSGASWQDFNRDWPQGNAADGGTPSNSYEIDALRNDIVARTGGSAAYLIDIHSHAKIGSGAGWYWWYQHSRPPSDDEPTELFDKAVWTEDRAANDDESVWWWWGGGSVSGYLNATAESWGCSPQVHSNGTLGAYGFTLEPIAGPFNENRTIERIMAAGGAIGRAFNDVLSGFTLTPGDADGNGTVDLADLAILAANWNQPGAWVDGDFTGDATVDLADLAALATHWSPSSAGARFAVAAAALGLPAVPEPGSLALLVLGALGMRRRRR